MTNKPAKSSDSISIKKLLALIEKQGPLIALLSLKKVTAGFDGFVDTIVRIIKNKEDRKPVFFKKIKDFGKYVVEKEGSSFSVELEEVKTKLGGNMPIMANALGMLGVQVNAIGALGFPQTHQVFQSLTQHCHIYSFADPGFSTAYEFNDGKILMANMASLNALGWEKIKKAIGPDTLINLYRQSDLICILNWSEIDASTDIWKGLLKDILPNYASGTRDQLSFFDISDCSRRSSESISEALALINEFALYSKVTLSLNKNEAGIIYELLVKKNKLKELDYMGEMIFEKLNLDTLVLHSPKEAIAINAEGIYQAKSFFIKDPAISTGAGDNFNAGFCAAQLMQLDLKSTLIFANAVSGYYVKVGISPAMEEVAGFLIEKIDKEKNIKSAAAETRNTE